MGVELSASRSSYSNIMEYMYIEVQIEGTLSASLSHRQMSYLSIDTLSGHIVVRILVRLRNDLSIASFDAAAQTGARTVVYSTTIMKASMPSGRLSIQSPILCMMAIFDKKTIACLNSSL
ncbi:hypothetical protein CEXT_684471 [Caerostris extrusa]|uniref:Uncharacterized protein n=1 Tax=Caerostris extrusa TaxID=172846 RepID=A0AAV4XPH5_CAEEX|nr:hypothetical protein CEXT_684471 [Caerostris extrusa]